jgi:tetratricopeptide (TPR) repeat protein
MPDRSKSFVLWSDGLDHWQAGRLDEAAAALQQAVATGGSDIAFTQYLGSLGGVLGDLGRSVEAQRAFEQALQRALEESGDVGNASSEVVVARFFLAQHFLRFEQPLQAVTISEPSVGVNAKLEGILRFIRALAFAALGEGGRARTEGVAALELATSEDQRERMKDQLHEILGSVG